MRSKYEKYLNHEVNFERFREFVQESKVGTLNPEKNIHQAKLLLRGIVKEIQQIDDQYTVIHLDDFSNKDGFYLIRDNKTNQTTYQIIEEKTEITIDLIGKWFEISEK